MSSLSENIPFKRLSPQSDLLPFDCGNTDLTDYFLNSAKPDMQKLLSVTYYLEAEGKTVLFSSLKMIICADIQVVIYAVSEFGKGNHAI